MTKGTDKQTISSFKRYIQLEEKESIAFLRELCGRIAGWIPKSYIEEYKRHYQALKNNGFTKEKIITLIEEYCRQNESSKSSDLMLWSLQYENDWSFEHLQKLSQLYYINTLAQKDGMAVLLGNDSKHFMRGYKVLKGAQEGHKHTHGTKKEKQRRRARYQQSCEEYRAQHPKVTKTRIYKKVALDFSCSERTIQRHTSFI